ncbi:hypothetical protein BG55_12805 [Erwinia mallotivora]|uniref:Uncharacterized protein n=1 Tax=Erwinia mallotivora TaxID=69222 RepID=A0A014M028_9GAMM|nr:hypothetical protein BG55_12805 [Erwinia mallotivora]
MIGILYVREGNLSRIDIYLLAGVIKSNEGIIFSIIKELLLIIDCFFYERIYGMDLWWGHFIGNYRRDSETTKM